MGGVDWCLLGYGGCGVGVPGSIVWRLEVAAGGRSMEALRAAGAITMGGHARPSQFSKPMLSIFDSEQLTKPKPEVLNIC